MKKVVINRKYGGFGLSEQAVREFFKLKGWELFVTQDPVFKDTTKYWTKPFTELSYKEVSKLSKEEHEIYHKVWLDARFSIGEIPRDDGDLVKVVETLGEAANGEYANLKIFEVDDDDDDYHIDDYDGMERLVF